MRLTIPAMHAMRSVHYVSTMLPSVKNAQLLVLLNPSCSSPIVRVFLHVQMGSTPTPLTTNVMPAIPSVRHVNRTPHIARHVLKLVFQKLSFSLTLRLACQSVPMATSQTAPTITAKPAMKSALSAQSMPLSVSPALLQAPTSLSCMSTLLLALLNVPKDSMRTQLIISATLAMISVQSVMSMPQTVNSVFLQAVSKHSCLLTLRPVCLSVLTATMRIDQTIHAMNAMRNVLFAKKMPHFARLAILSKDQLRLFCLQAINHVSHNVPMVSMRILLTIFVMPATRNVPFVT